MLRYTILTVLALLLSTTALAQPKVLFVLDGSGSMWGPVDGRAKIETARSVLSQLLESLPAEIQVGLAAYGHNRKGDCSDIEILAPVGSEHGLIVSWVNALHPQGKTPLTESIRRAAAHFHGSEDPASIVLVSDGEETCGGDPCAAARQAAGSGIDLHIHVVGFDVTAEQAEQLECIASEGRGQYFGASNSQELVAAFAELRQEVTAPTTVIRLHVAGDVLCRPHYGKLDVPGSGGKVVSVLEESGPVLSVDVDGLLPNRSYSVYLMGTKAPDTTGWEERECPADGGHPYGGWKEIGTVRTDAEGSGFLKAAFRGTLETGARYQVSVWINDTAERKTVLVSDSFIWRFEL